MIIVPQLVIRAGQAIVQLTPLAPLSPLTVAVTDVLCPPSMAASEAGCIETATVGGGEAATVGGGGTCEPLPPQAATRLKPESFKASTTKRFITTSFISWH
jgi:hypothetical protein